MNDATITLVNDVLDRVGALGSTAYQASLHSTIVSATVWLWVCIIVGVLAVAALIGCVVWYGKDEDDEGSQIVGIIAAFLILCCVIGGAINGTMLAAPEWPALQQVITSATGHAK